MSTALLFSSNLAAQSDTRIVWTGANYLPRYPHTAIWQVKHVQQNGYYAVAWHSQNTGVWSGNDSWGFGTHPFPSDGSIDSEGASTFPGPYGSEAQHFMEIADSGNDYLASPSSEGTQVKLELQADVWYVQARTSEVIGSDIHMTFWPDLVNNPTLKIHRQKPTSYLGTTPSNPAFYFGASDWTNQGGTTNDEALSGYLRGMKLFDAVLTSADIITEATTDSNTPQTSAGTSSVWYINMDPTVADVTDKSGAGHNPTWANANRPTDYTLPTPAPTLTAGPSVSGISSAGFDVLGTTSADCTVALVVVNYGDTAPTTTDYDNSTETASATSGVQFSIHHTGA